MYLQCPANSDKGYWFKKSSSKKDNVHYLGHNEMIEKRIYKELDFSLSLASTKSQIKGSKLFSEHA